MRASILVGSHNEGDRLWRTVESIAATLGKLDAEVVVGDDGSTDGSVAELRRRFPWVGVVEGKKRVGVGAGRGLAARRARGDVLVFLDGHTKPEAGALDRLISSVEKTGGEAVITPQIIGLDEKTWRSKTQQTSHGYALDLETFDSWWISLNKMREVKSGGRSFYESPALVGCALAVSRHLYDRLWGFDQHMRQWGNEDLDFALKAWTMGARVLHDPKATVAHRFQRQFNDYEVSAEYPLANRIRAARKHLTQSAWEDWLVRAQERHTRRLKDHPEGLWATAWQIFQKDRQSAEHERSYLLSSRQQDEFWYAKRFDLAWPAMGGGNLLAQPTLPPKKLRAQLLDPTIPPPPELTSVSPNSAAPGDTLTVTLSGTFPSPVTADSTDDIEASGSSGSNTSSFNATYVIDSDADPQVVIVTVTDAYMQTSNPGVPFTITGEGADDAFITSMTPDTAVLGQTVTSTIAGGNFDDSCTVAFSPGPIPIIGVDVIDSGHLNVEFHIPAVITGFDQQVTVTNSTGNPSNPWSFQVTETLTGQIINVKNEESIAGTNQFCVVGQYINLQVADSGGNAPDSGSVTWTISDVSYVGSYTRGSSGSYAAPDMSSQEVDFYLISQGTATISVSCTFSGSSYSGSVTFEAEGPQVTTVSASFSNPATPVSIITTGGIERLGVTGIVFTFTADMPSETNGFICGVQIINSASGSVDPSGCTPILTASNSLDNCNLYMYLDHQSGVQQPIAAPANATGLNWPGFDAPFHKWATTQCTTVTVSQSFTMYFIYKTADNDSIWVTLGSVDWSWGGTAERISGIWELTSPSHSIASGVTSSTLPTWSSTTQNSVPITCPRQPV